MALSSSELSTLVEGPSSKSEKIRRLDAAGYSRSQIADLVGVRYQFVRNVLVDAARKSQSKVSPVSAVADTGAVQPTRLKIGSNGAVVLPEEFRRALSLNDGDTVIASIEDGELRLRTIAAAVRRVQAMVRSIVPEGVSLSDELLADRRREVEREGADGG